MDSYLSPSLLLLQLVLLGCAMLLSVKVGITVDLNGAPVQLSLFRINEIHVPDYLKIVILPLCNTGIHGTLPCS